MISIKNVDIAAELPALNPIMLVAWMVVDGCLGSARVTDIYRKNRGRSYHRVGLGTDFSTKNLFRFESDGYIPERAQNDPQRFIELNAAVQLCRVNAPGFDFVLEDFGEDNEHLHVEFDPRV